MVDHLLSGTMMSWPAPTAAPKQPPSPVVILHRRGPPITSPMQQRRTRQRTNAAALPAKERPRRARVLSDDDESSDGGWTRVEEDPDFEMVAAAPAPKNFLHRGQSEKSSDTSSYVGASVKSSQKEDKENLDDQRSQSDFSELSFGFGVSLEALACEPCEPAAQNPTPTPERAALSPVSEHCDGWCELLTGHTCDICAGRPRKSEVLKWFS